MFTTLDAWVFFEASSGQGIDAGFHWIYSSCTGYTKSSSHQFFLNNLFL